MKSVITRSFRSARRTKPVTEYVILQSGLRNDLYYLCPGCRIHLPREYMQFCDCCGQRLGWKHLEKDTN